MRRNRISIPGFVLLALFLGCALPALAQTPNVRTIDLNNKDVELAEAGNYQEAIDLFRQAIELSPDYALAHAHLGTSLYQAKRFDEAIKSLKKAIELKRDFAEASSKLGVVYADLGRRLSRPSSSSPSTASALVRE